MTLGDPAPLLGRLSTITFPQGSPFRERDMLESTEDRHAQTRAVKAVDM